MVVYACSCLNVRIFAEKIDGKTQPDVLHSCPLGPSSEAVELIDQGFQFSHKCLVQRMREGDWTVYVCVPCHMRTHAVNVSARVVAVSGAMKKGDEVTQQIKTHPDYSQIFHLLLSSANGRPEESIPTQSYETLQKQLGDLQEVLSRFLKQEEDAMEKRIRDYEEEQRNNFVKLKERAQKEKNKLVSLLFNNSEDNRPLVTQDRNPLRPHTTLSHSKSASDYGREKPNTLEIEKKNRRMRDSSPDVFAMDEMDLELEEVDGGAASLFSSVRRDNRSQSDNQNNSTAAQLIRRHPFGLETQDEGEPGQEEVLLMSTSVPISMPARAQSFRATPHLDDSFEEAAEFDDIPRHMQALSESIQERDRYIFGDRPRQRVHTGDFTQVNWHKS